MLRKSLIFLAGWSVLVLSAGCDRGGADPILGSGDDLEGAMVDIAVASDRLTSELIRSELDGLTAPSTTSSSSVVTIEKTFSGTRSCPISGELAIEGSMLVTFDSETGVMEAESTGTRTRTDCTFPKQDFTVTVNGTSQWEIFRRRVNGQPDGPQTAHYFGSWHAISSEGQERSCEFDYLAVRDPETHTLTIEGFICDKSFSITVTWDMHD